MDTKKTPLELEIERETEHRVAALKRERAAYEGRDDKKDRLKAVDAELSRLEGKSSDKPRESTAQGQVTREGTGVPSTVAADLPADGVTRESHVQGNDPQPDAAALEEPQTTTTPQADIVASDGQVDSEIVSEDGSDVIRKVSTDEAPEPAKPAAKKTAARKATAAKKS